MTHDELLARIDETKTLGNGRANELKEALRAVVELHKPTNFGMIEVGEPWCSVCHIEVTNYDCSNQDYPCPTIQTIERELQ